jgi:DNA repair protein SbcC/Rad50
MFYDNHGIMKILNLNFKNINSLEGENRIDFEQPPFTETGVFAITGPNGSGKSSILDAITLALYGETFRFDKPANHVITQHNSEGFSQVEFALGKDKYRSSWAVKRQNGNVWGEVLPTEMKLIRLNDDEEENIANTPHEVCLRIAELTGMNFRSFTRSILLAQGDFTAFLNALDTERMDILEKIIGSDIYSDYKEAAAQKLAEAEKNLTYLQQDLAAVPLIEVNSLEACELDLADFSDQTAEFQEEINRLNSLKKQLAETATTKSQIEKQEARLQEAISQRLVLQKKLDQLTEAESSLRFKVDIEATDKKKQALEREKTALNALQNELEQIKATLALPGYDIGALAEQDLASKPQSFTEQKQAIDGIRSQVNLVNANWQSEIILLRSLSGQITEKQTRLNELSTWLDEHSIDKPLLDNFPNLEQLRTLRVSLVDFDEKMKALGKWSKSTSAALQKNKSKIEKKNTDIAQLTRKLAEEESELIDLAQGNTREQIEELLADQNERVKSFEELVSLSIAYENLSPQKSFFFSLIGKKAAPDLDAEELTVELEALTRQQKQEENIRLALEMSVYNDALIVRMANDRAHLVDGKPCPLCGANDHPYSKRPPAPANAQKALLDQRIKLKRISARLIELEEHVRLAQKYAARNVARIDKLKQIKARWQILCNQLNIASAELDIKKTGMVKRLMKMESIDLKNITVLLTKYKGTQKRIEKIKADIEKTSAVIGQLQSTIETIDAEWQTEPHRVSETEAAIANAEQEEQALLAKITEQLSLVGEAVPVNGKEIELAERLNIRRQDYESYKLQKESLVTELDLLMSQQGAGQAQIDSYEKRIDSYNSQLQTEELVGLHLALVEKQKLIADKEQLISQLDSEMETLRLSIAEKVKESPFDNLEQVEQILVLMESQPELEKKKTKVDEDLALWGAELDALYRQLENNEAFAKVELPLEEIELKIKSAKEKMELAELEARRLEKIVREQKQYSEKHADILAKLQSQQTLVSEANAEIAEITAENGMVFRRRVQERMVEKLLSQANATLEKISGRYYLRKKPSERGLALEIEDTYQENIRRLPKTLSGGESFIVSLALALGLSEMASNGKSVDSLFLDEGFGVLDAENLYTVINTLEGLRAHGKIVGVISHVEAVQKRFKVQLQLIKKPNGLGELRKVS